MGLEAAMVLVDNSESSRNGDYQPSRIDAQADATTMIFQSITGSNPESMVGLMSFGGKGPEVLTTLTTNRGKVLEGLHRTQAKIGGQCHLWTALHIAFVSVEGGWGARRGSRRGAHEVLVGVLVHGGLLSS
jgi:26S proteasome regulatory subunit N10